MDNIEWQVQNEYYLDKFRDKNPAIEVRSFANWKSLGRSVRKGQSQKAYGVVICKGTDEDPITGEAVPRMGKVNVYGFTKDQTDEAPASQKRRN